MTTSTSPATGRTVRAAASTPTSTSASTLPSYAALTEWRKYPPFFPASMRPSAETLPREEWWRWRGLDVHVDRLAVPDAPLKILVLHGAGAYGRVMAPAAVIARSQGYETVAPDLPGYGLTRVPWNQMTYSLWVDCVCDLIDAELARDGRPVVLVGVSLGGLLAYQAAARSRRVVGLVATNLADVREREARQGLARSPLLGTAGLWLLERLAWATDLLPMPMAQVTRMHAISNDPALSALCSGDRLGGGNWVPARFLRTLMTSAPDIEPEDFRVCPVLLVHPGEDRMTDIAVSRRFFDRLGGDKKMVILEGASHMPTEHPGIDQLESSVIDFARRLAAAR